MKLSHSKSLIVYPGTFLVSCFVPIAIKSLFSSSIGPRTWFISIVVFGSSGFLLLGLVQGRRIFSLHALLLTVAIVAAWATFPNHPPMNFERQIVDSWVLILALAYAAVPLTRRWFLSFYSAT